MSIMADDCHAHCMGWRFARTVVIGLLCSLAAEVASADPPPPPQTPEGRYIREIRIERTPVFTAEDRAALPWLPLGVVNRLHVDTRERVIRRELLMEEGGLYDPEVIAESERKLREFGIFAAAEIVSLPAGPDSIDVLVRTRELWSTAANVAYESFEGDRLWTVEVRERNFLGTARGFTVAHRQDVDRDVWLLGLSDRQLFTTRWRGEVRWRDANDGSGLDWKVHKPFFKIADEWSAEIHFRDGRSAPRYYLTPVTYVRPDLDSQFFRTEFLRKVGVGKDHVWRIGIGGMLERQEFGPQEPLTVRDASGELDTTMEFPRDVEEDRDWRTVYASVERATRRYGVYRYLFAMGTSEDIPFGPEIEARLGWTTRTLGSSDAGMRLQVEADWFAPISKRWLQRARFNASGLLDFEKSKDLTFSFSLSEYHQPFTGVTLAGGVLVGGASGIERNQVFNLGSESGLRASRFRELAGDRLFRANTEFRTVYTPGLFRLFTPGIAVFADYGTAWFEQGEDFRWGIVRGAVGIGLRIGFNRAAADVPVRVDLAWPVLYPTEQSSPVLSIGTGHVF